MNFEKITEKDSHYNHLEKMSINEIIQNINKEDQTVPNAVEKVLPQVEALISQVVNKLKAGGRLFYIGAGTSGRLGILDASECPPTFGVPHDLVIGLIAGGDNAIRKAVENAEDDPISLNQNFGSYTSEFSVLPNEVEVKSIYLQKSGIYKKEEANSFHDFLDQVNEIKNRMIVLKKGMSH